MPKTTIEFEPRPDIKIWETVREICKELGVSYHHHYYDNVSKKYILEYFEIN